MVLSSLVRRHDRSFVKESNSFDCEEQLSRFWPNHLRVIKVIKFTKAKF